MLKKKYQKSNIKKVVYVPINTNQIIFFAVVFCLCSFIGIYLVYVQQQEEILQLKNTIIHLEKALSEQSLELDRLIKESEFPQEINQKKKSLMQMLLADVTYYSLYTMLYIKFLVHYIEDYLGIDDSTTYFGNLFDDI